MTRRWIVPAAFMAGVALAATVALMMGGSDEAEHATPRYSFQTANVVFGMWMEITDHQAQKAYLYDWPTGKDAKPDPEDGTLDAKLICTVDLTEAGQDKLTLQVEPKHMEDRDGRDGQ